VPPRISLVVPAHNEAGYLPRLLDSVESARAAYSHGSGAVEVIVADNASTDATAEIALARGCRVASVEKRAIAAARNGGAAIARGEILAFTDADGVIHPATFDVVDAAISDPHAVAGATGVTMERWSVGIAATYAVGMLLIWMTGMDTGVVFCWRSDFAAVGGYDERRLVAEDVAFLRALKRHGRREGRRLVRPRGVKAVASTRKFDEHGEWHFLTRMPLVALRLLRDPAARPEFLDRYWYRPER
jgi:glycosyltransferase involved in cell wall biosynthesis